MFEFISHLWQVFMHRPDHWAIISIIPVTAFVTWAHVWMALKMVFYPIQFWGFHVGNLPIGWQGIVPRKAGRISGIITDNTLTKIGSLSEFLEAMDPEEMAKVIGEQVNHELENLIDEIMLERNPVLWENIPYSIRRRIYEQAHKQLPAVLEHLVTELTYNVESLVDMREMVVRQMEADRKLMVRMFLKVGQKEINFIWHISALIGCFFGLFQMIVWFLVPWHWTVPFWASIWGFLTNWIAIWMVFNPMYPHYVRYPQFFRRTHNHQFPWIVPVIPRIGTYNIQGAFMKRQEEVSDVFAKVVTEELITLKTIMGEMMYGHHKERTRRIVKQHVNQIMDTPLVRTTLQLSLGLREYAKLKTDLIDRSIEITMVPVSDPAFNASRARKIFQMFRDRIRELTPNEFQNLLRPAFKEDEWILIVLGGVTGFIAGTIHLFVAFL
ncbi:membrane protein [Acinetobacter brisouii]|uniref:membrane protein n=1 Tax=Acinetobacter brisouii TaxID=396323 RepID=UPI0005F884A5|nr:membrane protein [Acinetobacter brisouii]KJV40455.1 membrane protein [Acinetobacter brisouii]